MWTLSQIEEAFNVFKDTTKTTLEVWWRDDGLCIFGTLSPEELEVVPEAGSLDHLAYKLRQSRQVPERLEALKQQGWRYEPDANEYGDPCWVLFRSD